MEGRRWKEGRKESSNQTYKEGKNGKKIKKGDKNGKKEGKK